MAWDWKSSLKLAGVLTVVVGGVVVTRRIFARREELERERNRQLRAKNTAPKQEKRRTHAHRDLDVLQGIYDPGRRMSPYVVERLHPELDPRDVVDRTVNLSPSSQRKAYEFLRQLVFEDGYTEQLSRHELVRRTLQAEVAPDVDWRDGIEIYPVEGAEERIWNGVGEIYDVVAANYEVHQELESARAEADLEDEEAAPDVAVEVHDGDDHDQHDTAHSA